MADITLPVETILHDIGIELPNSKTKSDREFFDSPTHADGAKILHYELQGQIIYERLSAVRGNFWRRTDAGYFEPVDDMFRTASEILCNSIYATLSDLSKTADPKTLKTLYERAGTALKRAKTREFLSGVLAFFAELVLEKELPAAWNAVPQCLPCLDAVLDFSGQSMIARPLRAGEFFRDPLPVKASEVMSAIVAPQFELFLMAVAPDPGVRKTLREVLSLAVANRGHRTIGLFTGPGSNGKSMLAQILQRVLPGRIAELASAAISRDMSGAKRFAAAELEHRTFAFVEEQLAPLDVSELKRLAGDAPLAVEKKGLDPCEIPQTWALAILSNGLPSFAPATDAAFVSRLIVVPFETSFYFSEGQRQNFLRLGVPEERLKPAEDKSLILKRIEQERPAILKTLIETWIRIRDASNGRPSEAPKCIALKESYRSANDKIEEFFLAYFKREDGEKVQYDEIVELYRNFFNDKSISTRDCIKKLTDRFPWLERCRTNTTLYLKNLARIDFSHLEEDPKGNNQNTQSGIVGIVGTLFQLGYREIGKNPITELKNDFSIPSIPERNLSMLTDGEIALASKTVADLLQASGETARVPVGKWRNACAAKGMDPQTIATAEAYMQQVGLLDGEFIKQPNEGDQSIEPPARVQLGKSAADWPAMHKPNDEENADDIQIF